MMRTRPCSFSVTYWLQLPGAAPRSITSMPGFSKSFLPVDLLELVNGARTPALAARPLHVRVAFLALAPAARAAPGLLIGQRPSTVGSWPVRCYTPRP